MKPIIKIKGQWKYLYRKVDTAGQTIDFLLTAKTGYRRSPAFFRKVIRHYDEPEIVTIDKSGANTFRRAQTVLAGIELVHTIRKGQLQDLAGAAFVTDRKILSLTA